jgi:thiamine-monophosphate kinase
LLGDVYDGLRSVGNDFGLQLIGGNISSSAQLFIDITLMGTVRKDRILRRDGARRGDSIFVTGYLGASAEGLKLLREGFRLLGNALILPDGQRDSKLVVEAILRHIDPPCLIEVAKKLAGTSAVTSMIDLSDGISADLPEICRESGVGARIELERLPIDPCVLHWERKRKLDPEILALQGGEDYHLLFTVARKNKNTFLNRINRAGIQVFEIGQIMPSSNGIQVMDSEGKSRPLEEGYQHFVTR